MLKALEWLENRPVLNAESADPFKAERELLLQIATRLLDCLNQHGVVEKLQRYVWELGHNILKSGTRHAAIVYL